MRDLLRTTWNTIRNNKAGAGSAIGGLTSITLFVLAACLHSKPVSSDLVGTAITTAVSALTLCVASYHRKGNDWCESHNISAWRWM